MEPNQVIDWLLGDDQPAVKYFTLLDLLEGSQSDPEARIAYAAISERGWAAEIFQARKPDGFWESYEDLYRPKYVATNWRLLVLADLGLTAKDERVRGPFETLLKERARPDGGFASPKSTGGHFCVTGNTARMALQFGLGEDARVRSAFDWLVDAQKQDGGWHCFTSKRGTLDCWEALSAFAALPRRRWTRRIKRSVERGAEFYLERRLMREGRKRYEPWLRFHYPVHYYYDVLLGLELLMALGYGDDKRVGPAVKLLKDKRLPDGTWPLDSMHPDIPPGDPYQLTPPVYPFSLEKAGQPSKWITLRALRVLKRIEGLEFEG